MGKIEIWAFSALLNGTKKNFHIDIALYHTTSPILLSCNCKDCQSETTLEQNLMKSCSISTP